LSSGIGFSFNFNVIGDAGGAATDEQQAGEQGNKMLFHDGLSNRVNAIKWRYFTLGYWNITEPNIESEGL
jgi:hypothetical protein